MSKSRFYVHHEDLQAGVITQIGAWDPQHTPSMALPQAATHNVAPFRPFPLAT